MRKEELKLTGMDRIIMSMNPRHKWNDITKTIEDPMEVWQRSLRETMGVAMGKNSPIQKAYFGKTLDLIWLTQGILEDLVIHLSKDNPKNYDRWLKAINRSQEYLLNFKDLQPSEKLKRTWNSKVIELHNSYVEEEICKDLGVKTFKEAKRKLNNEE